MFGLLRPKSLGLAWRMEPGQAFGFFLVQKAQSIRLMASPKNFLFGQMVGILMLHLAHSTMVPRKRLPVPLQNNARLVAYLRDSGGADQDLSLDQQEAALRA